jgi:SAM-dependent methyltransferase
LMRSTFLKKDLNSLDLEPNSFDGIWCSFTAAYFPNFENVICNWIPLLKQNAWICLTEVDDLFGHEPMPKKFRTLLDAFYKEAFTRGRYDFRSGHKISASLKATGFKVHEQLLADQELAFNGPADPAVIQAWSERFNRMGALKSFFGAEFEGFKSSFLTTLTSKQHRSTCQVFCVLGTRS